MNRCKLCWQDIKSQIESQQSLCVFPVNVVQLLEYRTATTCWVHFSIKFMDFKYN